SLPTGNGRPPRGGVDRNGSIRRMRRPPAVAPHAGAWIETVVRRRGRILFLVAPHAGAWIETPPPVAPSPHLRRPPRGGVDRNQRKRWNSTMARRSPPTRGRG